MQHKCFYFQVLGQTFFFFYNKVLHYPYCGNVTRSTDCLVCVCVCVFRTAIVFSLIPPTGRILPVSDTSPVIATFWRTDRLVARDNNAVTIVQPALGPSLGVAPCQNKQKKNRKLLYLVTVCLTWDMSGFHILSLWGRSVSSKPCLTQYLLKFSFLKWRQVRIMTSCLSFPSCHLNQPVSKISYSSRDFLQTV